MTEDRALTAMCLWEAWLEIRNSDAACRGQDPIADKMAQMQAGCGTASCREYMLALAEECDEAWVAADALGYGDSFDWDFCPDFLRGIVENGSLEARVAAIWERAPRQMVAGDIS